METNGQPHPMASWSGSPGQPLEAWDQPALVVGKIQVGLLSGSGCQPTGAKRAAEHMEAWSGPWWTLPPLLPEPVSPRSTRLGLARLLTGLWEHCPTGDLGTGLGCGSGSHVLSPCALPVGPSVRQWLWLPNLQRQRRAVVGWEGLMLCCLSSYACPAGTRDFYLNRETMQGWAGPGGAGSPWDARTDGGRKPRLYCESAPRQSLGGDGRWGPAPACTVHSFR